MLTVAQNIVFHSEECSENNISTTKYPCVKSTGEVTTCYRYSGVIHVVVCCSNSVVVRLTTTQTMIRIE